MHSIFLLFFGAGCRRDRDPAGGRVERRGLHPGSAHPGDPEKGREREGEAGPGRRDQEAGPGPTEWRGV